MYTNFLVTLFFLYCSFYHIFSLVLDKYLRFEIKKKTNVLTWNYTALFAGSYYISEYYTAPSSFKLSNACTMGTRQL
jgi:hypothetical protein